MARTTISERYRILDLQSNNIGVITLNTKMVQSGDDAWFFSAKVKWLGPQSVGIGEIKAESSWENTCFVSDWSFPYETDGLGIASWCVGWIRDRIPTQISDPWLRGNLSSADTFEAKRNHGQRRNRFWKRHLDLTPDQGGVFLADSAGEGHFKAPWIRFEWDLKFARCRFERLSTLTSNPHSQ